MLEQWEYLPVFYSATDYFECKMRNWIIWINIIFSDGKTQGDETQQWNASKYNQGSSYVTELIRTDQNVVKTETLAESKQK